MLTETDIQSLVHRTTGKHLGGEALRREAFLNFESLLAELGKQDGSTSALIISRKAPPKQKPAPSPSPVMLATDYQQQDVTGWLVSEKYDGVRCLWDGKNLLSRNGNIFNAPGWFKRALPADTALDGELFLGRGQFQKTPGIVRKKVPFDAEWQQLTFMVFDAPHAPGSYRKRFDAAAKAIAGNSFAKLVSQSEIADSVDLQTALNAVIKKGGEGVVLRNPTADYQRGYSDDMLKLKPTYTDEALVVSAITSAEKGQQRVQSLKCRWGDVEFFISQGLSDNDRLTAPPIGKRITFEYESLTDSGKPRFGGTFLEVRDYE